MKGLTLLLATLTLTGCGTYGEPLLLSYIYDRADSCQSRNFKDGVEPSFCGGVAGKGRSVYVNGQYKGYVKIAR